MVRSIKLRVPVSEADKLKELAKAEDRTMNAYINRIIRKHLEGEIKWIK